MEGLQAKVGFVFSCLFKKVFKNMTKKEEKETFNEKASGMTFDKFDDLVISWGRKRFGDKYAQKLWKNELVDLMSLDRTPPACGSSRCAIPA